MTVIQQHLTEGAKNPDPLVIRQHTFTAKPHYSVSGVYTVIYIQRNWSHEYVITPYNGRLEISYRASAK